MNSESIPVVMGLVVIFAAMFFMMNVSESPRGMMETFFSRGGSRGRNRGGSRRGGSSRGVGSRRRGVGSRGGGTLPTRRVYRKRSGR